MWLFVRWEQWHIGWYQMSPLIQLISPLQELGVLSLAALLLADLGV